MYQRGLVILTKSCFELLRGTSSLLAVVALTKPSLLLSPYTAAAALVTSFTTLSTP